MSDQRLRELERAHAAGDPVARLRVLEELRRLERPLIDPRSGIELVYVEGGEVECRHAHPRFRMVCRDCSGSGQRALAPFYLGRFPVTNERWEHFWVHRPREMSRGFPLETRRDLLQHPVVRISHVDALAFCAWSGLRLPTEEEWRWAALGSDMTDCDGCGPRVRGSVYAHARPGGCPNGGGFVMRDASRRFPWGSDPPTPERCVVSLMTEGRYSLPSGEAGRAWFERATRPRGFVGTEPVLAPATAREALCSACDGKGGTYAPGRESAIVVTRASCATCEGRGTTIAYGPLVPARQAGASWCGALDMAGNVWEWTAEFRPRGGGRLGGSWRSRIDVGSWPNEIDQEGREFSSVEGDDETGFRVALSVTP